MPHSWIRALNAYSYPVDLSTYERAHEFPGFFEITIMGDRNSTIEFENHYRETAPANTAAFFEVVYWKLYSQKNRCQKGTNRIVDFVQMHRISPRQLWDTVQRFVQCQDISNLKQIRKSLGISTDVLAIPLTLPALVSPETIPIIDNQVAKWVNRNLADHNTNRNNGLTTFEINYTSLRQNDFPSYLNWVVWCQEVAQVLTEHTRKEWRARDVEMAVFTAQRNRMALNVLP